MVTETTENGNGSSSTAKTALGIGIGALGLLLLQNGALGNVFGGRPAAGDPPWARDLAYERALTERDAKIGKLESQLIHRPAVQRDPPGAPGRHGRAGGVQRHDERNGRRDQRADQAAHGDDGPHHQRPGDGCLRGCGFGVHGQGCV